MDGPDEKRAHTSDVYLVVDSRERGVVPFIEGELKNHAFVQRQINTGDYLICRRMSDGSVAVLACVERKTHDDFAASFKDGRYENVRKMRALRVKTGCHLLFFVEGPAFPSPNRRFNRIPFSSILSAMTKMVVRDGIFIVQTEDESHTAKRLHDFLRAYESETPHAGAAAAYAGGATDGNATDGAAEESDLSVPAELTGRIEETEAEASVVMWARLRGISVVLGKILSREFSVADLVAGKVGLARLKVLKTSTGRTINKDALESLSALRSGSRAHAVKVVSGLRNITPATAEILLDAAGGIAALCGRGVESIAAIALPQKKGPVAFGKKRAERLRRMLHFCEGRAPPAEPVGHRLGSAGAAASSGPAAASSGPAAEEGEWWDDLYGPVPGPAPGPAPEPVSDADLDALLAESGFGE